jgi:hypothetical protein
MLRTKFGAIWFLANTRPPKYEKKNVNWAKHKFSQNSIRTYIGPVSVHLRVIATRRRWVVSFTLRSLYPRAKHLPVLIRYEAVSQTGWRRYWINIPTPKWYKNRPSNPWLAQRSGRSTPVRNTFRYSLDTRLCFSDGLEKVLNKYCFSEVV